MCMHILLALVSIYVSFSYLLYVFKYVFCIYYMCIYYIYVYYIYVVYILYRIYNGICNI